MTPYLAQAAAMAMEDAVVLARCSARARADPPAAFARFGRAQRASLANRWMSEATDPGWVHGYDPWTVELDEAAPTPR